MYVSNTSVLETRLWDWVRVKGFLGAGGRSSASCSQEEEEFQGDGVESELGSTVEYLKTRFMVRVGIELRVGARRWFPEVWVRTCLRYTSRRYFLRALACSRRTGLWLGTGGGRVGSGMEADLEAG